MFDFLVSVKSDFVSEVILKLPHTQDTQDTEKLLMTQTISLFKNLKYSNDSGQVFDYNSCNPVIWF